MKIEDALRTAIEFEAKVTTNYVQAAEKVADPVGKRVFQTLAKEEEGHINFLRGQNDEWQRTGHLTAATLKTAIPSRAKIKEGMSKLKARGGKSEHTTEIQFLQRALELEVEIASFYKRMVSELSDEGQQLFKRFVEIEEGHVAIVQAQIDAVSGLGFWFEIQEFQLEAG